MPPLGLAAASSRGAHTKVSDRNKEMVGQALCHVPPAEQLLGPGEGVGGCMPLGRGLLLFFSFLFILQ